MPSSLNSLTRRRFSQLLAASAASAIVGQSAHGSAPEGFAHLASAANGGALHTFRITGADWRLVESLPSPHPAHLEPHPTLSILYTVHEVPLWEHLPRGAVSAYTMHPETGRLTHLHTQPLSLAATHPRHAAVSPDGTLLAVASPSTGIYNVLALGPDGTLHPPTIIRKELGPISTSGLHFLSDSRTLVADDSAGRRIHAFTIEDDFLVPVAPEAIPALAVPIKPDAIPDTIASRYCPITSCVIRPA